MVAEGEREFAEGNWQDSEEMFSEMREELLKEESSMSAMVCE